MNIGLLLSLFFILSLISLIIFICYFTENSSSLMGRRYFYVFLFIMFWLLGLLGWIVSSAIQPWKQLSVEYCDIKYVTYPDGSQVQMFIFDGKLHNVTTIFGKVVDVNEWKVKCAKNESLYNGISWKDWDVDKMTIFSLEKKK